MTGIGSLEEIIKKVHSHAETTDALRDMERSLESKLKTLENRRESLSA